MQQFIAKITQLTAQANETDDQRAARLSETAEESGAEATTLFEVEQELRGYGEHVRAQNAEKVGELESELLAFAPMLGMDPEEAGEKFTVDRAIDLLTMQALGKPQATAAAVKTLHETFTRHGLYDELGTETPRPGERQPPRDADGGPVEEPEG